MVSGHAEEAYRPILESLAPQCATVVVLMGLGRIEAIAGLLLTRGWNPSTPAAVLLSAATADAATVVTTLAELERGLEETQTRLPGTVVIGEVVRLRARVVGGSADENDVSALSVRGGRASAPRVGAGIRHRRQGFRRVRRSFMRRRKPARPQSHFE